MRKGFSEVVEEVSRLIDELRDIGYMCNSSVDAYDAVRAGELAVEAIGDFLDWLYYMDVEGEWAYSTSKLIDVLDVFLREIEERVRYVEEDRRGWKSVCGMIWQTREALKRWLNE